MTLNPADDFTTKEGAALLVERIRTYWRGRGYQNIPIWAVKTHTGHGERYDVRSDLRGGTP